MPSFKVQGVEVFVDQKHLKRISKYVWWITYRGYVVTKMVVNGKRKTIGLNRFILNISNQNCVVGYRDKNKYNNLEENLVVRTYKEHRVYNKLKRLKTKGFYKSRKRQVVRLRVKGKFYYFGSYDIYTVKHLAIVVKLARGLNTKRNLNSLL